MLVLPGLAPIDPLILGSPTTRVDAQIAPGGWRRIGMLQAGPILVVAPLADAWPHPPRLGSGAIGVAA